MTKKILTAVVALAVSFALWLYVVMVIGPEYKDTFRDIPVVFQGVSALEENNLMILTEGTPTVTLELSGNRSDLNKLSSSNISVTLDLSKILDPGKTAYRYDVSYPGNVAKDSITIQSQSPTGITLEVVRRSEKTVPVEVVYNEEAITEGYGLLPVEQELDEIRIVGPQDVIGQITVARVSLEITEENNKSDIVGEYVATLCDKNGQEVDSRYVTVTTEGAETISVSLPIRMKKVIPLTVKVIEGGGATAENTPITISPSTITVLGSEEMLKDLNEWSIGEIDLSSWEEGAEPQVFPIVLPEGLTNKSGVTEATVTVSLADLTEKSFVINRDQIRQINVPAGTYPEISEEQLVVTVRGTERAVNALEASDIIVTVDFAEAKIGQMKDWTVTVSINGEPADAGVIGGPYAVWVEIMDSAKVTAAPAE